MIVKEVDAISLGVVEREATEQKKGWSAVDFVVVGESSSRRCFIDRDNSALLAAVRTVCAQWGTRFAFDGDVYANGNVRISAVYPGSAD